MERLTKEKTGNKQKKYKWLKIKWKNLTSLVIKEKWIKETITHPIEKWLKIDHLDVSLVCSTRALSYTPIESWRRLLYLRAVWPFVPTVLMWPPFDLAAPPIRMEHTEILPPGCRDTHARCLLKCICCIMKTAETAQGSITGSWWDKMSVIGPHKTLGNTTEEVSGDLEQRTACREGKKSRSQNGITGPIPSL